MLSSTATGTRDAMTTCTHPSERLHAWWARDDTAPGGQVLVVACNDCGAVLQGAYAVNGPAWPSPTMGAPSLEELEEFEEDGGCLATPHGHPSWLLVLGMI